MSHRGQSPNLVIVFLKRFYLLIHERHTKQDRDIGRGRSRLPMGSWMPDSILGLRDYALSQRQDAQPLTTQVSLVIVFISGLDMTPLDIYELDIQVIFPPHKTFILHTMWNSNGITSVPAPPIWTEEEWEGQSSHRNSQVPLGRHCKGFLPGVGSVPSYIFFFHK